MDLTDGQLSPPQVAIQILGIGPDPGKGGPVHRGEPDEPPQAVEVRRHTVKRDQKTCRRLVTPADEVGYVAEQHRVRVEHNHVAAADPLPHVVQPARRTKWLGSLRERLNTGRHVPAKPVGVPADVQPDLVDEGTDHIDRPIEQAP